MYVTDDICRNNSSLCVTDVRFNPFDNKTLVKAIEANLSIIQSADQLVSINLKYAVAASTKNSNCAIKDAMFKNFEVTQTF